MSVPYLGDFSEDATVYMPFNTFDSNDPSGSVTITDLADGDIKVHKDASATEIVTDGATVSLNFDSVTGNHLVTIDTSVHADYSTGSDYLVRMEGTTVDGATINAWIGHFSIENRHGSTTANSVLTDTEAVLTDSEAILTDSEAIIADTEAAVPVLTDTEAILADTETGLTERATLLTDTEAVLADTEANAAVLTDTEAILADTETIGTPIDFGSGTSTIAANLQDMADNGTATFDRSTDSLQAMRDAVISDTETILTDSEAILADTEANTAVLTDTEAILADTETGITERATLLTDTEAVLADSEAILTDSEAILTDAENLNLGIIYGAAQTGTLSTTVATTDLTGYANDELIGRVINFTGGDANGQASDITDYASTNGTVTFTAITTAPANGDTFKIV